MAIRRIIQSTDSGGSRYEQEILTSQSTLITTINEEVQGVVKDLVDTMSAYKICVGLSAPQIGQLMSVAVARFQENGQGEGEESETVVLINPEVIQTSGKKDVKRESCMSVWGFVGSVERRHKLLVRYQTLAGQETERDFRGFPARVIQHEINHLEGRLYSHNVAGGLEETDLFGRVSQQGTSDN